MNPFTVIPAHVRRWLYLAWAIAGLVLGAVAAYTATTPAEESLPWLGGLVAALGVIGTGLGFTAAANTAEPTAVLDEGSPTGEVAGEASPLPTGTPVETTPAEVMAEQDADRGMPSFDNDAEKYDARHDAPRSVED